MIKRYFVKTNIHLIVPIITVVAGNEVEEKPIMEKCSANQVIMFLSFDQY